MPDQRDATASPALPRSAPADQDVDGSGIQAFIDGVAPMEGAELHSLMVVRHGFVVAEQWWHPYTPKTPQLMYSLSKSFTSTALGFAVAEGLVDLDATVLSYFPEYDRAVTDERARSIRVRHVAAMASGHETDTVDRAIEAGDGDMLLGFLLIPPDREPGSVFAYNQPCTYALSAIVRKVSGVSLTEFLRPRLFEPLGIDSFGWHTDTLGRELGYTGLHVPTEAVAKLGLLYLRNGEWNGRRLLPAAWVAEATRPHVRTGQPDIDWDQGYGFQFWRSRHGYRGDGAYGQFMLILPEADAVVAITSQSPDMPALLEAVWTHLLPALEAGSGGAWAPSALSLPLPTATDAAGALESMTFLPGPDSQLSALRTVRVSGNQLVLADGGGELTVRLGESYGWSTTGPLATAYGWAEGRLHVDIVFVETPHRLRLVLDPRSGRFDARWQTTPLLETPLSTLRMPR
jgi:CubicO group peptidase (beta-lactamase class C family)